MGTRARWATGAVHAVLVVASLGLLATSLLFDLVSLEAQRPLWAMVALRDLEVGLAAGVVAAALAVASAACTQPGSRRRRLEILRVGAQGAGLVLFAVVLALRPRDEDGELVASMGLALLSAVGLGLTLGGAWLTAELAGRLDA
jgi:uncharacterized membrane protein